MNNGLNGMPGKIAGHLLAHALSVKIWRLPMYIKGTYILSVILFSIMLPLFIPKNISANENHPFYRDIKEAYKDSELIYDSKVEQLLYRKLPAPKDIFEQSGLGSELPQPRDAKEEQIMMRTIEALHRQFFKKVKTGGQYCPVEKIKKNYAQSPEQRIGISSGGYYRLFVAYWTLKVKLDENRQNDISKYGYGNYYYIDSLLTFVESNLAGAFFPTPGPNEIPESLRRKGIQQLLDTFAPTMTIKKLYEGANPVKAEWPVLK